MERWTFDSQRTDIPANGRPDNLHSPVRDDGGERGRHWHGHTRRTSAYTAARMHPGATAAVAAGLAACAAVAAKVWHDGLPR
jgi:hypothetical protein